MGIRRFGPSETQVHMEHVFTNAMNMITASAKAGTRRVFFITNQDNPHTGPGKQQIQKACIDRIRDYYRRGIDLEPFFISAPGTPFQINTFYADILGVYDDGLLTDTLRPWRLRQWQDQNVSKSAAWDSASKFAELEEQISSREVPKRVVFDVLLDLGPLSKPIANSPVDDLHAKTPQASRWRIHVKGYNVISEATRDLPVKVTSYGQEDPFDVYEIVNVGQPCEAVTGEPVRPEDTESVFPLCDSDSARSCVSFSDAELKQIRQFGCIPGLLLLGFKDRSTLHFYENTKHSYFLYPSDLEHPGSKCAFAALLHSMLSKNKVALTLFMPRENAVPAFAVLLPQAEELDASGHQYQPPGMHLIVMPFIDDIREPPSLHALSANSDEVGAASKIIESFQRRDPFNPDVFANPALQFHYEVLMAQAFHRPAPIYRDTIMPDYDLIERRSRDVIQAWNASIQADTRISSSRHDVQAGLQDDMLRQMHREGTLGRMTLVNLKQACDLYGLPKYGRKADVISTLSTYLSTH